MTKKHPWELSDEFWNLVEPLIPKRKKGRKYIRKAGDGRKPYRPGKKGDEAARPRGRAWGPAVDSRHRGEPS